MEPTHPISSGVRSNSSTTRNNNFIDTGEYSQVFVPQDDFSSGENSMEIIASFTNISNAVHENIYKVIFTVCFCATMGQRDG